MGNIRRYECAECGTPMFIDGRILCPDDSEHIGEIEVEYVPASQLREAVEALRGVLDVDIANADWTEALSRLMRYVYESLTCLEGK